MNSSVPINPENIYHDKEDIAEWQYFSPEEFSSESMDALDVVFINKGSTTWTNNYYLSHYAEINPSNRNKLYLDKEITPGETCSIRIPIINNDVSWKSCWELTDDKNTPFFSFCYNHGIGGQNQGKNESLATNNPANSNYSPFTYVENALPSSAVNNSDNAEWVSSNFNDQHAFCAYDHTETWSITLRNAGSNTWNSSYTLNFYKGYNFMPSNTYSVDSIVDPGNEYTFNLPMIIHEDNDMWHTCWYLANSAGENLINFCWYYNTDSNNAGICSGIYFQAFFENNAFSFEFIDLSKIAKIMKRAVVETALFIIINQYRISS